MSPEHRHKKPQCIKKAAGAEMQSAARVALGDKQSHAKRVDQQHNEKGGKPRASQNRDQNETADQRNTVAHGKYCQRRENHQTKERLPMNGFIGCQTGRKYAGNYCEKRSQAKLGLKADCEIFPLS